MPLVLPDISPKGEMAVCFATSLAESGMQPISPLGEMSGRTEGREERTSPAGRCPPR